MSTLVVRYIEQGRARWGKLSSDVPKQPDERCKLWPIVTSAETTSSLIAQFDAGKFLLSDLIEMNAKQLISPITADGSIYCQGLNYGAHAAEAQHHTRKSNLIFSKASSSLTGPFDDVVRPLEVELLDYEVEIGIVVRADLVAATKVTEAGIGEAIAGVVLSNDVSARDTMFGSTFMQWYLGKSYRTFCPTGPALVLLRRDEVSEMLESLEINLWLNGELRQSAPSSQLIWKPAETISYISGLFDLKRGDLLLTGTPGGVTAPASPKLIDILKTHLMDDEARRDALRAEMSRDRPFMQPGDVVSATLRDLRSGQLLGGLANTIVAS